jgi:hypothetical protein
MDLLDRIEGLRFLGREFLLWLWFQSELFETELRPSGDEPIALWLEAQLTLSFEKEESRLRGAVPASSPEAKQALRQGKLPKEARLRVVRQMREFVFVLKADALALSGLKVPAELAKGDEKHEIFYERMMLVEELEQSLAALYADFTTLRLSESWEQQLVPVMRAWAHDEQVDADALGRTIRGVVAARKRGTAASADRAASKPKGRAKS